ncbi:hypothetical protein B9J78_00400 [bacterium Unc6]|nr:hypothetical protein [bacterium Unc6]
MPLLGQKEVLNLKLSCIPLPQLKIFALNSGMAGVGSVTEIIKKLLENEVDEKTVNEFIKQRYEEKIRERKAVISDEDLKKELLK